MGRGVCANGKNKLLDPPIAQSLRTAVGPKQITDPTFWFAPMRKNTTLEICLLDTQYGCGTGDVWRGCET